MEKCRADKQADTNPGSRVIEWLLIKSSVSLFFYFYFYLPRPMRGFPGPREHREISLQAFVLSGDADYRGFFSAELRGPLEPR